MEKKANKGTEYVRYERNIKKKQTLAQVNQVRENIHISNHVGLYFIDRQE